MDGTKYIIHWDYVDNKGFAHMDQRREFHDKVEANTAWIEMKKHSCYANMRAETVQPEKHLVTVAFKTYDYIVEGPVKIGDTVKVISGGQVIELEVLKLDPPKKPGINYVCVEEVIRKKKK